MGIQNSPLAQGAQRPKHGEEEKQGRDGLVKDFSRCAPQKPQGRHRK